MRWICLFLTVGLSASLIAKDKLVPAEAITITWVSGFYPEIHLKIDDRTRIIGIGDTYGKKYTHSTDLRSLYDSLKQNLEYQKEDGRYVQVNHQDGLLNTWVSVEPRFRAIICS